MKSKDILQRDEKHIFKEPHSVLDWYGKDQPGKFNLGELGTDPCTFHLTQDFNWDKVNIKYEFNSMGLRGPEPNYNSKHRILCAGGSFIFGTGIDLENMWISKLCNKLDDASYINISDSDSVTEVLDPLNEIAKDFRPTCIVLGDARFLDEYGWTWRYLWTSMRKLFGEDQREFANLVRDKLANRNRKTMELLLFYLKEHYKVPVFFVTVSRKDFNFKGKLKPMGTTLVHIKPVDLARDNRHPGIQTHENIAQEIFDGLKLD